MIWGLNEVSNAKCFTHGKHSKKVSHWYGSFTFFGCSQHIGIQGIKHGVYEAICYCTFSKKGAVGVTGKYCISYSPFALLPKHTQTLLCPTLIIWEVVLHGLRGLHSFAVCFPFWLNQWVGTFQTLQGGRNRWEHLSPAPPLSQSVTILEDGNSCPVAPPPNPHALSGLLCHYSFSLCTHIVTQGCQSLCESPALADSLSSAHTSVSNPFIQLGSEHLWTWHLTPPGTLTGIYAKPHSLLCRIFS